jgi:hypothetical protein
MQQKKLKRMTGCRTEYEGMPKTSFLFAALAMLAVSALVQVGASQCKNQIAMVPLPPLKAADEPRDFVRFRYAFSSSDSILIRSHEDTETSIGPYDLGFVIQRNGTTAHSLKLGQLPEFRREDTVFSESFTTVAIARACGSHGPVFFVTMKYMGDEISPALVFVVLPFSRGI